MPAAAVALSCAEDLETKYGATIRHLAVENRTGYKLMVILKTLEPPLYASTRTSETWLRKYGLRTESSPAGTLDSGHLQYQSAREMEDDIGDKIRSELALYVKRSLSQRHKAVLVSKRLCKTWLARYGIKAPALKRPATHRMTHRILKRQAPDEDDDEEPQ